MTVQAARKRTWLYFSGPSEPPSLVWEKRKHSGAIGAGVSTGYSRSRRKLQHREASATPVAFARALIALAALSACSHPDPYWSAEPERHHLSTERLVYAAPHDFQEQTLEALDEWSQATGLDLVLDNAHPWATRIEWVPTVYGEKGQRLLGAADVTTTHKGEVFVGCAIKLTFDATEAERWQGVRHEIGHCLAYRTSHHGRAGCIMHENGGRNWCAEDVEMVDR